MKLILLFILTFCSIITHGQGRYTVLYNNGEKLLINDSKSYGYNSQLSGKRNAPLGKRFLMHSTYRDIKKKEILSQSQPYNRGKYLIIDTLPDLKWQIGFESKIILNNKCIKQHVNGLVMII
jgi:GLPGLI family protein